MVACRMFLFNRSCQVLITPFQSKGSVYISRMRGAILTPRRISLRNLQCSETYVPLTRSYLCHRPLNMPADAVMTVQESVSQMVMGSGRTPFLKRVLGRHLCAYTFVSMPLRMLCRNDAFLIENLHRKDSYARRNPHNLRTLLVYAAEMLSLGPLREIRSHGRQEENAMC